MMIEFSFIVISRLASILNITNKIIKKKKQITVV